MNKPKVLITPLCGLERGQWLNPTLAVSLATMKCDPRFDVEIQLALGLSPVDYARNTCVAAAREKQVTWLLMVDADQTLPQNPLDVLAEASPQIDAVGLACGISLDNGRSFHLNCNFLPGVSDGNFMGVSKIGTGVMALRDSVWRTLPRGPWFVTERADDELLTVTKSEDIHFCEIARACGLKLWAHRAGAGHLKTTDLTAFAMQAMQRR